MFFFSQEALIRQPLAGRPPYEDMYGPQFRAHTCDILSAQTTADPRRRSVIETYCGSKNSITDGLKQLGYKVDRTCMYRRLVPNHVCIFWSCYPVLAIFRFHFFYFFFVNVLCVALL